MRAPLSWIREFTPVDAPVPEIGRGVEPARPRGRGRRAARRGDHRRRRGAGARRRCSTRTPTSSRSSTSTSARADARRVRRARTWSPGMVVPYAPPGATLPGGFTLERRKIRGEVSDGMLLLGDGARPRRRPLGDRRASTPRASSATTCATILGLDDVIFDLVDHAQPPRRDVHRRRRPRARRALQARRSTSPSRTRATDAAVANDITVVIEAPDRCPRYLGRVARVTMGESPAWMAQRLVKAGMRPISNVVDVTNYVLLERNQPLHAFDLVAARRPRHRRPPRRRRRAHDHARRRRARAHRRRPPHLRRRARAAGHRRDHGRVHRRGVRRHHRDPARVGLLRAHGHRQDVEAAQAPQRVERALRARHRSRRGRAQRRAGDGAARRRGRRAGRARRAKTCTRRRSSVQRITRAHEPRERGARHRSRRRGGVGRARRRSGSSSTTTSATATTLGRHRAHVPSRPRARDRPRRGGRPPRSASTTSAARCPTRHGQVGVLTAPPARAARWSPTRSSGSGSPRRSRSRWSRPPTSNGPARPLDRLVRASNPLRAEESVLRTRDASRAARGRWRSTARTVSHDVALFEQGHVFLTPRDRRAGPLPDEPEHVAVGDRRARCAADRWRTTARSTSTTRSTRCAPWSTRSEIDEFALEPADIAGYRPGRSARVLVGGADVGAVGEVADAVVSAARARASGRRVRGGARRARRRAAARPPVPRRRRASRRRAIDLAFVARRHGPGRRDRRARCAPRSATCSRTSARSTCSGPTRSAPGGAASRSRCGFRAPDRTLTDAEVGELRQRAIDAVDRGHGAELRG